MSALATQTKTPTDVESQTVTQAIASWGEKIANIDTQITDVRARREAADLDMSVESDAIEDECSAELRRLKDEIHLAMCEMYRFIRSSLLKEGKKYGFCKNLITTNGKKKYCGNFPCFACGTFGPLNNESYEEYQNSNHML